MIDRSARVLLTRSDPISLDWIPLAVTVWKLHYPRLIISTLLYASDCTTNTETEIRARADKRIHYWPLDQNGSIRFEIGYYCPVAFRLRWLPRPPKRWNRLNFILWIYLFLCKKIYIYIKNIITRPILKIVNISLKIFSIWIKAKKNWINLQLHIRTV